MTIKHNTTTSNNISFDVLDAKYNGKVSEAVSAIQNVLLRECGLVDKNYQQLDVFPTTGGFFVSQLHHFLYLDFKVMLDHTDGLTEDGRRVKILKSATLETNYDNLMEFLVSVKNKKTGEYYFSQEEAEGVITSLPKMKFETPQEAACFRKAFWGSWNKNPVVKYYMSWNDSWKAASDEERKQMITDWKSERKNAWRVFVSENTEGVKVATREDLEKAGFAKKNGKFQKEEDELKS